MCVFVHTQVLVSLAIMGNKVDVFMWPPDTDTDVSHLYCQANTSAGDRYRKTGTSEIRGHSKLIFIDLFGKDML